MNFNGLTVSQATSLRDEFRNALLRIEPLLPGGNLRAALLKISAGGLSASPFPEKEVDRLRDDVRKVLREHGFDEGRKLKGKPRKAVPKV